MDKTILNLIGKHRKYLTRQQFKTLKGQVRAGDYEGALKGLEKLLGRK